MGENAVYQTLVMIHTIPDSFCAGTKTIPDSHIRKVMSVRFLYRSKASYASLISKLESRVSDRCSHSANPDSFSCLHKKSYLISWKHSLWVHRAKLALWAHYRTFFLQRELYTLLLKNRPYRLRDPHFKKVAILLINNKVIRKEAPSQRTVNLAMSLFACTDR